MAADSVKASTTAHNSVLMSTSTGVTLTVERYNDLLEGERGLWETLKAHGKLVKALMIIRDSPVDPAAIARDALATDIREIRWSVLEAPAPSASTTASLPDIELVAAAVHDAWMAQKRAKGITSAPSQSTGEEQMRPYAELSNEVQEYDRATVRAVYDAIRASSASTTAEEREIVNRQNGG